MRRLLPGLLLLSCSPAESGLDAFRREAVPVLEARCTSPACHGVAAGAEAAGERIDRAFFVVDVDRFGRIRDEAAAYRNVLGRVNSREGAELSTLLREPLSETFGGLPHAGGTLFDTPWSEDYLRLLRWARAERSGREGKAPAARTEGEAVFATRVYPALVALGCGTAACHGDRAFGGLFLGNPAVSRPPFLPAAELHEAYREARRNLVLGPHPERSRLIAKILPLGEGGVPHKGGNDVFTAVAIGQGLPALQQPEVQEILSWIERERLAAGVVPQGPAGIVFVRGPLGAAGPFDEGAFVPGSDVWLLAPAEPGGGEVNLTQSAHPEGPADVRDPAVTHDARRVLFSMRRAQDPGFRIWEIGVDGSEPRQLTHGPGDDRSPAPGPGGSIVFTSTRGGLASDWPAVPDWDLFELRAGGTTVRHTRTPGPEIRPAFHASGEFAGTLGFTVLRAAVGGELRAALFRFPLDRDRAHHLQPEYHVHHGLTTPPGFLLGSSQLPDGRFVTTHVGPGSVWEGGRLAILERQFGPELPEGGERAASVPGFRHAFTVLTPGASAEGFSPGGVWRDPWPLPDGRLIAAHGAAPLDLSDPVAPAPDLGVLRLELGVDDRGRARIERTEVLVDRLGVAEHSPRPVVARLEEDGDHPPAWDPARSTGIFVHAGVVDSEALGGKLRPDGERPRRGDLRRIRFVSAPEVPASDMLPRADGGTAASLLGTLPSFVLGEVPIEEDGSVVAELPADTPFRVVFVNEEGLAVGTPHPQWFSLLPGERFPQGVPPWAYGLRCGGCHGAHSGSAGDVLTPRVDIVSQASVTLATHVNADPRRPRPPAQVTPRHVDFRREVAPLLDRACAGCHGGAAPAAALSLQDRPAGRFSAAYRELVARGLVHAGGAARSPLAAVVLGHAIEGGRQPPDCPARRVLEDEQVHTLLLWMDLGSTYAGG